MSKMVIGQNEMHKVSYGLLLIHDLIVLTLWYQVSVQHYDCVGLPALPCLTLGNGRQRQKLFPEASGIFRFIRYLVALRRGTYH